MQHTKQPTIPPLAQPPQNLERLRENTPSALPAQRDRPGGLQMPALPSPGSANPASAHRINRSK